MRTHKQRFEAALKRKLRAQDRVWALAQEHGNLRFSELLSRASVQSRLEYEAAASALAEVEQAAISAGKAYRPPGSSLLYWRRGKGLTL